MEDSTNNSPISVDELTKLVGQRSYAVISTASPAGWPHAAGVIYSAVGTTLYFSTMRSSRKARNIEDNSKVAVSIPVRRIPFRAPPSTMQFQGRAEILANDAEEVARLAGEGKLKAITGHGELDLPDGCVVKVTPNRGINTYGLGMSLRQLARDPLNAAGRVELPA